MISVFLREQKRYSQKELLEIFDCSEEQLDLIISKLICLILLMSM